MLGRAQISKRLSACTTAAQPWRYLAWPILAGLVVAGAFFSSTLFELDRALLLWVNQFARTSEFFDGVTVVIGNNELRGGVMLALLWWAWANSRTRLIDEDLFWPKVVAGTFLSIGIARLMQNLLPERLRPLHDAAVGFELPFFATGNTLAGWSSFPSDHAALFIALATATFFASSRIGWLALSWSLVFILLPRVYLGLHYPSDMVAGAVLGAALMLGTQWCRAPRALVILLQRFEDRHRGLAYALAVIFSFQCATLFMGLREILSVMDRAFLVLFSD